MMKTPGEDPKGLGDPWGLCFHQPTPPFALRLWPAGLPRSLLGPTRATGNPTTEESIPA
jgi:hypothetical protein